MSPLRYQFAARTDRGRVREINEDSFALLPGLGVALVADGMGGHAHGELASTVAVSAAAAHLLESPDSPASTALAGAVESANREILASAAAAFDRAGMGTTLLATRFTSTRVSVAHVGDCRLYRLRGGSLERLTRDQTLRTLLEETDASGEPPSAPRGFDHLLTQALGTAHPPEPELLEFDARPDDLYLLCSDGLTGMLDEHRIRLTLGSFDANLDSTARGLIADANEMGGHDNITVVLARQVHCGADAVETYDRNTDRVEAEGYDG